MTRLKAHFDLAMLTSDDFTGICDMGKVVFDSAYDALRNHFEVSNVRNAVNEKLEEAFGE